MLDLSIRPDTHAGKGVLRLYTVRAPGCNVRINARVGDITSPRTARGTDTLCIQARGTPRVDEWFALRMLEVAAQPKMRDASHVPHSAGHEVRPGEAKMQCAHIENTLSV